MMAVKLKFSRGEVLVKHLHCSQLEHVSLGHVHCTDSEINRVQIWINKQQKINQQRHDKIHSERNFLSLKTFWIELHVLQLITVRAKTINSALLV
jgi:hypothetical protein